MKIICRYVNLISLLCLSICTAKAATHYLVPPGTIGATPANPYTSWETAGTSVIDVAKAAMADGSTPRTVLATNGVYVLTNDVIVTNIVLQSVNGRDATIFNGNRRFHFVMNHTNCVLDGLTVTNGWSSVGGGGILVHGGTVTNCLVTACANEKAFGAGICIANGSVVNSTISGNTNVTGGGGITIGYYVESAQTVSTGRVENCIIKNNYVTDQGGGVRLGSHGFCSSSVVAVVKNCLIMDNVVNRASRYGGGVFIACTNILVANCTIVRNYASSSGGGIAFYTDSDRSNIIVNCVIVSNVAGDAYYWDYRNIRKAAGALFTNAVAYSCSTPNTQFRLDVIGNTTNDPAFTDFATDNFRFNRFSPCFNSGINQPDWMSNASDMDGHARILHGRVDMGAYELFIPSGTTFKFR